MLRIALEPAFILHRRSWRETSELIDVITRHHGRLGVLQRGVRGARQARRGRVQAFTPVLLSAAGREDGLLTASAVEATASALVRRDLALACGFYLNELIVRLIPRSDPCPAVFDAYVGCLGALSETRPPAPWLRWFEYRLLRQLGELPSWRIDVDGEALVSDAHYQVDRTGALARIASTDDARAGSFWLALARGNCDEIGVAAQKPLQRLMRERIDGLLGSRRLHSRDMLELLK